VQTHKFKRSPLPVGACPRLADRAVFGVRTLVISREKTPELNRGSPAALPHTSSIIHYVEFVWKDQTILSRIRFPKKGIFRAFSLQTRQIAATGKDAMP
jgi:hypothetical protein